MEKIAIIGFGEHVTKNIIPAIGRMSGVYIEAVYVRDVDKYKTKANENGVTIKWIDDPINDSVNWVYISTPISTHYSLCKKYILEKKNIICEKPLTNNYQKTLTLMNLANENNVLISEVCMYQYHRQFKQLKHIINEKKEVIKIVKANFSIPHLDKNNIRYKKSLAGGGLLDVGYYPISLVLSLFGLPIKIKSSLFNERNKDVDLNGFAIFEYNNFYCMAEWGIGLPYTNKVEVITEDEEIKCERIFSKPETFETEIIIKERSGIKTDKVGLDDQFVNMFNSILSGNVENKKTLLINSVLSELYE